MHKHMLVANAILHPSLAIYLFVIRAFFHFNAFIDNLCLILKHREMNAKILAVRR